MLLDNRYIWKKKKKKTNASFEMRNENERKRRRKRISGGGPTINYEAQSMTMTTAMAINNKSMALKMLFIRKCRYKNLIDKLNCVDCFFAALSLSVSIPKSGLWLFVII